MTDDLLGYWFQGTYNFTSTSMAIRKGGVPSGKYKVTLRMKQRSQQIGCVEMQLAVA